MELVSACGHEPTLFPHTDGERRPIVHEAVESDGFSIPSRVWCGECLDWRPMRQRQRHEIRDDLIKACIRFETSYQSDTYNAHYDDELAYCDDMIDEFSTELANVLTEQYSEETTQGGSVPTCDLDNPKLGDIKIIVRSTSDTEWIAEVMRFGGHIWGSVCVRSGPTRDSAIAAADDRINKLRSDEAAEAVKQQRLLDSLEVLAR